MKLPFNGTYPLTQGFGVNPENYAKFGLKGHDGLDYGLPSGTSVYAPHAGVILEAANDATGYGNYVKIQNDHEGSVLAHLESWAVTLNQQVNEGDLIGLSNNTGNSTGPHLHWGYYPLPRDRSNGFAGFIDQSPLLVEVPPAPVTVAMPDYLQGLFREQGLDWNNESLTREFWQQAIDCPAVKQNVTSLSNQNQDLTIANNQQTNIITDLRQQLAACQAGVPAPQNPPPNAPNPPVIPNTLWDWIKHLFGQK